MQKAKIDRMNIMPNFIKKLLDLMFKTVACEINKLIYLKDMVVCYFAFKNNKGEYEYAMDVKQVDFGALESEFTNLTSLEDDEIHMKFDTL